MNRSILRLALPLIGLILIVGTSWAQRRGQVSETTTVTLIEVPVQISAKGQPVRNLTKADFELMEGRKRQEITAFEMIDLKEETSRVPGAVPVGARRHFLAMFDLSNARPDSVRRAREAASNLLLERLHPTDLVGVATFHEASGANLVLPFTSDRHQIGLAIATLGLVDVPGERDPLGLVLGDITDFDPSKATSVEGFSLSDRQEAALQTLSGRAERDSQVQDWMKLSESMVNVAKLVGQVEGHKHVLFLSEGFDSSLLVGNEMLTNADRNRAFNSGESTARGQFQEIDTEERDGDRQAQGAMRNMVEEFQRAGAAIQAINIGGMVAGSANKNTTSLFMMADGTGGNLYDNFGHLGDAMRELLDETSVTYLLGFQPKQLKNDGEFHEIKVRVKNLPRGARVSHRPGYYPPKPISQRSGIEQRMQVSQQLMGGRAGGAIDVAVLATAFEVPGEDAYVPVFVEIGGTGLMLGSSDVVPTEIYVYAIDSGGTIRDFFVRNMGLDPNAAGGLLKQTGLKYYGHFDLAPGDYVVRAMVRNTQSGISGLEVGELSVPSADGDKLLLPLLFHEQPGIWVMGREDESEQRAGVPFPFMQGQQPYIPAARPRLQGSGEAPISVVGYNLGAGALSADCTLVSDSGERVGGVEITLDGDGVASGVSRVGGSFKTQGVAPGDYTLEVTVNGAKSSIPVTVS